MYHLKLILVFISLLLILSNSQSFCSMNNGVEISSLITKLVEANFDSCLVGEVNHIFLQRDIATFELLEGKIHFFNPTGNLFVYALFEGKGNFYYEPPSLIEKEHLQRFIDSESVHKEFNKLFLFFTDSTYNELQKQVDLKSTIYTKGMRNDLRYCIDFFSEDKNFDEHLLLACLDPSSSNFYAHIIDGNLFFAIDPYSRNESNAREDVMFMVKAPGLAGNHYEIINLFSAKDHGRNNSIDKLSIRGYDLNIKIEDNLNFVGKAILNLESLPNSCNWFFLRLDKEFKVDSVFWNEREKGDYFKTEEGSVLWLKTPGSVNKDENQKLTIYYKGDILERDEAGWIYISSALSWYPRGSLKEKNLFDITFNTPAKYKFISVGKLISEEIENDRLITHWAFDQPISMPSFNIGYFNVTEYAYDDLPKISIYKNTGVRHDLNRELAKLGYLQGSNMEEVVGSDIVNSYSFFSKIFGKLDYEEIRASEIPYLHGQAFPGLIHLSWTTFYTNSIEGLDQIFRAHEVSHQWWGVGVDFETYHDQWLSEGFAEYSGLWYLQNMTQNNELFFNILDDWKDEIVNSRKYIFGSGQEAGPIWLGYRTQSSNTLDDYNLIIYKKGAWVLHMLRNILLDINTMSDDKFISMMADFFKSYNHKRANTEDFSKIVSKHCGIDMTWFFDQWVRDTEIPKYNYRYKIVQNSDETYRLKLQIEQFGTEKFYRTFMPIKFIFDNGKSAIIKVDLNEPVKTLELPSLPFKLDEIEFNYLNSVLCEYEEIDWE